MDMHDLQHTINIKGSLMDLSTPKIMGILNVTTDSFFDGNAYRNVDLAVNHAREMLRDGAEIIDVGGASSRPGADAVSVFEELKRVLPVIEALRNEFPDCIMSIDTNRSEVALKAIQSGADIVNDISAGDDDEDMLSVVGRLKVPYIAMHKKGNPQNMQINPQYQDMVQEVVQYFMFKQSEFKKHGILDVIFDPGFGFGKTVKHNYTLLKNLNALTNALEAPILVGVSRKSMINKVLHVSPTDALNGTTVINTLAVNNGADILRVHDVKEAKEVVTLFQAYKKG